MNFKAHVAIILIASLALASSAFGATALTPTAPVSTENAIAQLKLVSNSVSGIEMFKGEGTSMLPHYGENSLLLVKKIDSAKVRKGMIIVYRDSDNDLVGHLVAEITNNHFITKGFNNDRLDPVHVNSDNLIGTVVGTLHTASKVTDSSLPSIIGKVFP